MKKVIFDIKSVVPKVQVTSFHLSNPVRSIDSLEILLWQQTIHFAITKKKNYLKALRQPSQKFSAKNSSALFFQSNLYLDVLDHAVKIFSKLHGQFLRKVAINLTGLTYCFSPQPEVVYNFSEIESTFPVPISSFSTFVFHQTFKNFCYCHVIKISMPHEFFHLGNLVIY